MCRRYTMSTVIKPMKAMSGVFLATLLLLACQQTLKMSTNPSPVVDSYSPFSGSRAGGQRSVAGVSLCWCPAGRFIMGSPPDEPEHRAEESQVLVTLTRGFWMG